MGRSKNLRKIVVEGIEYLWSTKHFHNKDTIHSECIEILTIYREGYKRSPLKIYFNVEESIKESGWKLKNFKDMELFLPILLSLKLQRYLKIVIRSLLILFAAFYMGCSDSKSYNIQNEITPDLFSHFPNTAIHGYDKIRFSDVSTEQCARLCIAPARKSWCVSFDYNKYTRHCYLSDKRAEDAAGLKADYLGYI